MTINRDIIDGNWKQFVGEARIAWGKLTNDDWAQLEGHAERLAGVLQERYGYTRAQAEAEIARLAKRFERS